MNPYDADPAWHHYAIAEELDSLLASLGDSSLATAIRQMQSFANAHALRRVEVAENDRRWASAHFAYEATTGGTEKSRKAALDALGFDPKAVRTRERENLFVEVARAWNTLRFPIAPPNVDREEIQATLDEMVDAAGGVVPGIMRREISVPRSAARKARSAGAVSARASIAPGVAEPCPPRGEVFGGDRVAVPELPPFQPMATLRSEHRAVALDGDGQRASGTASELIERFADRRCLRTIRPRANALRKAGIVELCVVGETNPEEAVFLIALWFGWKRDSNSSARELRKTRSKIRKEAKSERGFADRCEPGSTSEAWALTRADELDELAAGMDNLPRDERIR